MQEKLFSYLSTLCKLYPVKNCLIVGSGRGGYLPLFESLDVNTLILVEADKEQISKMYKMHTVPKSYRVENVLIADDAPSLVFNVASSSVASGTRALSDYQAHLPNLRLVEEQTLAAQSLDTFVHKFLEVEINWLILDTFSAAEILSHGERTLGDVEVLLVSSLVEEGTTLADSLEAKGFRLLETLPQNNPAFVTLLLVKDYAKVLKVKEGEVSTLKAVCATQEEAASRQAEALLATQKLLQEQTLTLDEQSRVLKEKVMAFEGCGKELAALKEELLKQEKLFEEKNNALVTKTSTLETELEKFRADVVVQKEAVEAGKAALSSEKYALEEVRQEKKALEEKSNLLATKTNTLEKDVEKFRAEVLALKEAVEVGKATINSEKKVVEHAKQEVATAQKSLEAQKSLVERQVSELNKSKFVLSQLSEDASSEELLLVAKAENLQNLGDYFEAIACWQALAGVMGAKMPQLYYNRLAEAYEKIGGFPLASEEEEALSGSFDKHEALAQLHAILKPKFYFEVGVQTGKSLQLAKCKAIGIDPMPRLSKALSINMELLKHTSDDFFENYASHVLTESIDLAFVDGMHLFGYALRDFINVEKYTNASSTVVMDDIYPGHVSQASRDRKTRAWTGDVWKLAAILKKYRKDLHITMLNAYPTGLMVITNLDATNTYLQEHYDAIVSEFMDKEIDTDVYIARSAAIDPQKYLEKLKEEMR